MVNAHPPALALRARGLEPSTARLPENYKAACVALAQVVAIDEAKGWADWAEAARCYARQADDPTLLNHAMRIKARAVQRCGELLAQVPPARGAHWESKRDGAVPSSLTRESAATEAGLSERQRKECLRVAAVPAAQFESAVESANPPTISQLANMGRKRAPAREEAREPTDEEAVAFYLRRIKAALSDDWLLGIEQGDPFRTLVRAAVMAGPREDRARMAEVADWLRYLSGGDDGED